MENIILRLFGLNFHNFTFSDALEEITFLIDCRKKTVVFTPNVDHVIRFNRNQKFRGIYNKADLILNDSQVLFFSSKLLAKPLKGKISGSDLLPALCKISAQKGYRIFFLGGSDDSSDIAARKLRETYKSLHIVGTLSPELGFENDISEVNKIIDEINKAEPEILFVGLGTPKQELFISKNKDRLNTILIAGIGASFEFASGRIRRAPKWMQDLALEWLFRLVKEPRRLWKRYLFSNTLFIMLFVKLYFKKVFSASKNRHGMK
ncbi:MAG: WecB/TagA/CpsF family glycosyltransferase [Candidatus Humimicrobiaceae bacterium]